MSRMKQWNESFKRLFESAIDAEPLKESMEDELRTALDDALFSLSSRGEMNIKAYEIAFQDAIEKTYPDHAWWEVTDCNIFFELFETRDLEGTVNAIIDQLKPEFKEPVTELFDVKVDATEFGGHGNDVSVLGGSIGESVEDEELEEGIFDFGKKKLTGRVDVSASYIQKGDYIDNGLGKPEKVVKVADNEESPRDIDVYVQGRKAPYTFSRGEQVSKCCADGDEESAKDTATPLRKSLAKYHQGLHRDKMAKYGSKYNESVEDDDSVDELFDLTVDAHNFGGSNNNVGIGGKMFESADAQYVYENGKGEAVDVFVKEDEDGNFYWEDNVGRSDDTFYSREEALDDCEQFVMSEAPGIVFKRLNEQQLTEDPTDIPSYSFKDLVNKNWKADEKKKKEAEEDEGDDLQPSTSSRTSNSKGRKTIRPYNPKQKGLDDKIIAELQKQFGGKVEKTKQGSMWIDTKNKYRQAKRYLDKNYRDASFTFDESISNGHGLNINAPITVHADGANVPVLNGSVKKESLVRRLKEHLSRLNEAEMSPEDRADSDTIRSVLDKIQKRKNARLTPEEQSVITKYGLVRSDHDLYPTDASGTPAYHRPMEQEIDTDNRTWSVGKGRNYRNGDTSKINYADRARKAAQRQANATYGHDIIPTARSNKHSFMSGGRPDYYNRARRDALSYAAGDTYRDMEHSISRRNSAQQWVDSADDTFAKRVTAARAQFDRAMSDATDARDRAKTKGVAELNAHQDRIDTMLRRKPKTEDVELTEAPMYDLSPEYDSRQSFYRKARVDTGAEGKDNKLYSYDTLVAEMVDGRPVVYGTYSQTTLRHIKEWLKQHGFKAETSKQIMADYGAKNEGLTESSKLPSSVTIKASELCADTDDEDVINDAVADYLSDKYGFCHDGFNSNIVYNDNDEPSVIEVTNIRWDVDEKLTESITITKEIDLEDFEFWSGARDRVKYLTSDDFRQLEYIIEEMYPDGCSETTINDIFWFEEDWIAEMLGYEDFEQLMEERESEE